LKHLAAALAFILAGCATISAPHEADLLIRGGTIYPGAADPFVGDVAVRGDRILAVGKRLGVTATRTIDAKGLIVAPGFIDPHAHAESWLTSDENDERLVAPFLLQGVTTTLVGNDGFGPVDVKPLLASTREKPVGINYASRLRPPAEAPALARVYRPQQRADRRDLRPCGARPAAARRLRRHRRVRPRRLRRACNL
jgi:adenine deaminase